MKNIRFINGRTVSKADKEISPIKKDPGRHIVVDCCGKCDFFCRDDYVCCIDGIYIYSWDTNVVRSSCPLKDGPRTYSVK